MTAVHEPLALPAAADPAPAPAPAPAWGAAARAAPPVARAALAGPAAPLPPAASEALGHDFARVQVAPAAGERAEAQAAEAARRAPAAPGEPAPAGARAALGEVRVHTGPRARAAARALRARAFAVGPHLVFGEGEYAPDTADGRALLAHELAHAAQADAAGTGAAPLRRDVVNDPATGAATGFEFRVGTELRDAFAQRAQGLVADGALSDDDTRALVRHAVSRRGTVDDHERMFMAGLRDPANVTAFQAVRVGAGAAVTFSLATIRASYAHVVDVDRTAALPAGVAAPLRAAATAAAALDPAEVGRQVGAAETAASAEIVGAAGPFRVQGTALEAFAAARSVMRSMVLRAMQMAASDSTPGDRLLAGSVYAVAASAGHALAADVLAGRVKVDALIPRAFARLPGLLGGEVAVYVTAAQGSGMKGDTIYMKTDFDIANTSHRSAVIHELDHAGVDRAASPTGTVTFPNKVDTELRAYRAQARYLFAEMERQTAAERATTAAQVAADRVNLVYAGAILEAQTDPRRFQPLAEILFGVAPAPFTAAPARVATVIALPAATIETAARTDIAATYRVTATDPTVAEGLAGESIIHWIDRI